MVPIPTQTIPAQDWTCAITRIERRDYTLRFRIEYGHGPDFVGVLFTATTLDGREIECETHTEDPEIAIGWPSGSLRDVVMPRVRELTALYNALKPEGRRYGR